MQRNFLLKQNNDEAILLLRASTYAYAKAKRAENTITLVLLFLAFAYPIFYVLSKDDQTKLMLFQVSFFLTVFVQIFTPSFKGNTSKGALLKEEFDTTLFGLPWKTTLKKIDPFEVSKLSVSYKGKEIKDWYPTNFNDNIPDKVLIAICQRCNTAYDIELRKKYSFLLFVFLIIYTIAFALTIVFKNIGGNAIFFICFSIISFYTHFVTIIRGHRSVIEKRTAINSKLDSFIFGNVEPTTQELRDIQDEIYITRQENAKVPNLFFRFCKKGMNKDFDDFVNRVNKQFGKYVSS
jgi:hypothetical protein